MIASSRSANYVSLVRSVDHTAVAARAAAAAAVVVAVVAAAASKTGRFNGSADPLGLD